MATNIARIRFPSPVEQRREPRLPVVISRATVRKTSQHPVDAVLHDLSVYGCRVASQVTHRANDRIWLRFTGTSPVAATVIWSDGQFTGCRFDEPIANSLFRSLTRESYGLAAVG